MEYLLSCGEIRSQIMQKEIWSQFAATNQMLENAISICPQENWNDENQFWYISFHTLFYLDYYLTIEPANFSPPPPVGLSEFDPSGKLPSIVHSREELLEYLNYCNDKLKVNVLENPDKMLSSIWKNDYHSFSFLEMTLYNMRHVQHHVGQLNKLLRLFNCTPPRWVKKCEI